MYLRCIWWGLRLAHPLWTSPAGVVLVRGRAAGALEMCVANGRPGERCDDDDDGDDDDDDGDGNGDDDLRELGSPNPVISFT